MASKFLDKDTDEILSESEFVKVYINDLYKVKGLTATQYKIFNFMLLNINYEDIVSYGPRTRELFLKHNDIKAQVGQQQRIAAPPPSKNGADQFPNTPLRLL